MYKYSSEEDFDYINELVGSTSESVKCSSCGKNNGSVKPHVCPLKEEVNGDDSLACNCCYECCFKCKEEI